MKLYTEEQLKRAMLHSYLRGVERPADYLPIEESILKQVTPIELPSAEDIEESETDSPYDRIDEYNYGFIDGANWVKEFILNQNKS